MCGIYGTIGGKTSKETLKAMGGTLRFRGPDDQGEFLRGEAGLGATRLSIIDLPGGDQPLFNEDKSVWVVQNGELYNYKELKKELIKQGHKFSSKSDTEVYAHLYEQLGLSFVDKLRGMYSIGLWDEKRKRLVLVRDRLGVKPLYFAETKGKLIFASEIKAILKTGIKRELDQQAFRDYLAVNYVPGPRSIFKKIKKLPAAHLLVWEQGKVEVKRYWNPEKGPTYKGWTWQGPTFLRGLLEESVKYHLVSDVPVGAFLSGGVDSSAVVALAAKYYGKKLRTFSVAFKQKSYDESQYAKQVAQKFGTKHVQVNLELKPKELVEKVGAYFDEPFADSSAVAVYAISNVAYKKGMKVILTGDGGDEVFGGYVTYQGDQLLRLYNKLPKVLREKVIASMVKRLPASHGKMNFEFKAKRFVRGAMEDPLKAHFLWKVIFTDNEVRKLLKVRNLKGCKPTVRLWEKAFGESEGEDLLSRLMLTDLKTSLVDDMLTKVDRMSMVNSLEARVPLLDHKVVEFMAGLPAKYKIKGLTLKWLLKKSLRGLLPDEILDRKKAGFHVPVAHWIKDELKDMIADYLSPTRLKRAGYFDAKLVHKMHKEHNSLKADYSREIWGLLMFEIWRERWLKA